MNSLFLLQGSEEEAMMIAAPPQKLSAPWKVDVLYKVSSDSLVMW